MPNRSSGAPRSTDIGSASPSSSPVGSPVGLSAPSLHELAVQSFRVGNRGRLSLCEALRVLSETRLFLELGFPSLAAYAGMFFQLRRTEAFEYVRVAKVLVELTELREAFGQGRIGWSALKAITRVASVASQTSWIEFVRQNDIERSLAEARDALQRDRDAPRNASFGLPNLDQRLVLRFSRSDMDKVRTWIESTCATVAENTGAEDVSLEQAILFLCERDMIHDASPAASPRVMADGDTNVVSSARANAPRGPARGAVCRAQIVYQHCPGCRKARVGTRDGCVEVASEEIGRYEGCAEQVVIDGPTPPKLRRRILGREAGRCGNPRCHHRADHCHHIVFRSRGGRTALANEVAVCSTCHALIHAGLIRVSGQANDELCWFPVAAGESIERKVASERAVADRLPVLQLVAEPANREAPSDGTGSRCRSRESDASSSDSAGGESAIADSGPSGSPAASVGGESAIADSLLEPASGDRGGAVDRDVVADRAFDLDDLVGGLKRLGVSAARSRRVIAAAIEALPRAETTEVNVLRKAIASI